MQASREDIKKINVLKKRADFLRVQKSGRKWTARGLILQIADGTAGQVRFGLTVSKRVSGSAVIRNRARRRLRAAARDILPLHAAEGNDFVLIGRTETEQRSYVDLKADLLWCLKKLDAVRTEGRE